MSLFNVSDYLNDEDGDSFHFRGFYVEANSKYIYS